MPEMEYVPKIEWQEMSPEEITPFEYDESAPRLLLSLERLLFEVSPLDVVQFEKLNSECWPIEKWWDSRWAPTTC